MDGVCVIGQSETHPGLFHAFGFNGHGFLLGPAVGAVLRELILEGRAQTDISGLGIGRFRAMRRESRLLAGPPHDQEHNQAEAEEPHSKEAESGLLAQEQHQETSNAQDQSASNSER